MQINNAPYTGWGRVLNGTGGRARPEKAAALSRIAETAAGPAIGALRAYGDAALNSARPSVDMSRMDRLIAFDPDTGVLEAEAGIPLASLLHIFAPRGWMPAVVPGTGYATLGGAIAADVHGKSHHEVGTFGNHVKSIRLLGPDGTRSEVAPGSDLFRATCGGMGLTGIIESAVIQMAPCPSGFVDVEERRMPNLATYIGAFEDSKATFSVGWIDATATGHTLGRGVLEEAEFTTRPAPFAKPAKTRPVPFTPPSFFMSAPVVRSFNNLYLRRVSENGRKRTRPIAGFFHPLDALIGWNKLYGKRGFHQFQCVLPQDTAAMALDSMLRRIAKSGLAAPLAVLKKMGDGRTGPLSFPMAGYTLAVDFPNRDTAGPLITTLIDETVEAGGRIYLAKDSVATADQVAPMYPDLAAFGDTVRAADPDGVFETDLARRLNLRGHA